MSIQRPNTLLGECIAEFIGTGLLIFFGVGCVAALVLAGANFGQWEISITWGLGVAIAIYVTGGISGAHLNPAVTLALMTFCGFDKRKVVPYIIAQMAGAFCFAALVYFLYGNLFTQWEVTHNVVRGSVESLGTAGIFSTYPNALLTNMQAFAVELVITAVLMLGIMALGDNNNGAPKGFAAALLIGILSGIIWFQGTIITSRLSEMDSYSQQLANLKAKSGAGVTIYSDEKNRNTYLAVLPKQAHGVETYTSTTDNTVVKYTAK